MPEGCRWFGSSLMAAKKSSSISTCTTSAPRGPEGAAALRGTVGHQMNLVTPGIRPAGSATGDQKRIMTPARAISAGADYLVVGRPVMEAADPRGAADAIQAEIVQALG